MINSALELLELGLSVVPLLKNKKFTPLGCTWKEQQFILPTEELIESRFEEYPDSDLGIITGKVSGIVVVDGDSTEACKWIEENFPHTWLTVSNNGRGRHYYYKYPVIGNVRSSASKLCAAVDVRGTAGLVAAPPSEHESGNLYQWNIEEGFSLEDLKDLPEYPEKYIKSEQPEYKEKTEETQKKYVPGELKNIADQCKWMQHCREDAEKLGYEEWRWMLQIVSRCIDGRAKAHKLSKPHKKYNYTATDRKIDEVFKNMGSVSCRTISSKFEGCFSCKNLIKGKKFSPVILGAEEKIEIQRITIEDIKKEKINNISLQMPEKIINPGGLISLGMAALRNTEAPNIPQYSFPIVVSVISRALMGKVSYGGVWPNFYMVKVGGTSTGKTDADKIMKRFICNDIDMEKFYGQNDFASGPGLLRGMVESSQTLINLDEISYLFKRFDKHDPITAGKIEVLLQLFTNCGLIYKKTYGNSKNSIILKNLCLSLIGNATIGIFDDIKPEDFISGLIQRFTFFCYDGAIPERKPYTDDYNADMAAFIKKIKEIYGKEDDIKESNNLVDIIGGVVEMAADKKAYARLLEFSKHIVSAANNEEDQGKVGIISRKYYESIKYAMIYLAGAQIMTVQAIDYGIDVADSLGDWKLNILPEKVYEGAFHRDCEIFKEGIIATLKVGKKPTGKMIANRRKRLKELRPHEFKNVITALAARKEIEIKDEPGRSTQYFLLKG